jgi:hypothetical protein
MAGDEEVLVICSRKSSKTFVKYLGKVFDDFPEQITSTSSSPAADHLFKIREGDSVKVLPEEQAVHFHHTVAQILFVSKRARPNISTAISFLSTRVKQPDEDDWGKLKRVLKYLKGTRHMKLNLTVDSMNSIHWWVDASYGTHWDWKGHTGMMASLGKGALMSFSHKHKLNAGSSTEAELIGIADALRLMMWGKYFIEAQGYTVSHNVLYQDNKSTILLAKNGRMSGSNRTKHIEHRFYLVKDKIDRGDLEIEHMGTDKMWSDILNKPKQGKVFREFRGHLMNVAEDYDDDVERRNTHPLLLPAEEKISSNVSETLKQIIRPVQDSKTVKPMIKQTKTLLEHRRSVLSEHEARAMRKSSGHNGKYPEHSNIQRWWLTWRESQIPQNGAPPGTWEHAR